MHLNIMRYISLKMILVVLSDIILKQRDYTSFHRLSEIQYFQRYKIENKQTFIILTKVIRTRLPANF